MSYIGFLAAADGRRLTSWERKLNKTLTIGAAVEMLRKSVRSILACDDDVAVKRAAAAASIAQCKRYLKKSFAADVGGDDEEEKFRNLGREGEADDGDESAPHLLSRLADLISEASEGKTSRSEALRWLIGSKHGRAFADRHKRQGETVMKHDTWQSIAKRHGVVAIAKLITGDGDAYGLSEHEFTSLVTEYAKRVHPGDRADVAFAKVCSASTEDAKFLRQALDVVKQAGFVSVMPKPRSSTDVEYREKMAEVVRKAVPNMMVVTPRFVGGEAARNVNRPTAALKQLQDLAEEQRRRSPGMSAEQAFATVYTDPANRELAARERAENRPTGHPSYPGR